MFILLLQFSGSNQLVFLNINNYFFRATLINQNSTLHNSPATSITWVANGTYMIELVAYLAGLYSLEVQVNQNALDTTDVLDYDQVGNSPIAVFYNASYPSALKSTVGGTGIQKAVIGVTEQLLVQINDLYGNNYNNLTLQGQIVY